MAFTPFDNANIVRLFQFPKRQLPVLREKYCSAEPFPHIVLDDVFDEYFLEKVLEEVPTPLQTKVGQISNHLKKRQERKYAYRDWMKFGMHSTYLISLLNSGEFLSLCSQITNIPNLIADPYLAGGGFHQILTGGKLGIHSDFNIHPQMKLDRRLNLLVYLNKDWPEEYGGHLELWDTEMKACRRKVAPIFNRMVIFSTTDKSFHGHPDPLSCPKDRVRQSLALYYYSNGRPESEKSPSHSTLWQDRPLKD